MKKHNLVKMTIGVISFITGIILYTQVKEFLDDERKNNRLGYIPFIPFFLFISLVIPHCIFPEPYQSLWVESPSGRTYELPLETALRIIRKRGWVMAKVEPVKTRWQYIKAAFTFRRAK